MTIMGNWLPTARFVKEESLQSAGNLLGYFFIVSISVIIFNGGKILFRKIPDPSGMQI